MPFLFFFNLLTGKKIKVLVCSLQLTTLTSLFVFTYVIDRAIIAAQKQKRSCSVTAGDGNHILNLERNKGSHHQFRLFSVIFVKLHRISSLFSSLFQNVSTSVSIFFSCIVISH